MVVMFLAPTQLFADDVEINKTNFPDSVFRHIVDSITGNTGTLTASTAQNITLFGTALVGKGIKDLTGLKYFTSLTNLDCRNNPGLTSIDLSGNNALQNLLITGCKVTSLDFSHNPDMTTINCVGMKTLTSINVDSCTNLEKLYIGDNPFTELNITNNKKLTLLSVYKTGLTTLDLSNNGKLSILYAFGNSQLQVLDLKNDTSLITLYAYDNNWPSIDVSTLAKLKIFDCHGNNLTKLDVSKNTALQTLLFYDNQLTTIDLSKNTRLTSLDCHNNKLTSLSLNLTDDSQLKTLSIYSNAMASFDMSNYTGMTSNNQSGRQHRRMMLYIDGKDAYMLVEKGIDASKISDATLNIPSNTTSITFSVGTENADGLVPLEFSNKAIRKPLFNWAASLQRVTPITISPTITIQVPTLPIRRAWMSPTPWSAICCRCLRNMAL